MCNCKTYWSDMTGCARLMISGMWCCIVCVAPLLMSFGILLLVLDNQREKDIREYNDAVARYAVKDARILAATEMDVQGLQMSPQIVDISIAGDRSGVGAASHYVFTRTGVPHSLTGTYVVFLSIDSLPAQAVLFSVPTLATVLEPIRCSPYLCTTRCDSSDYFCGDARVRSYCQDELQGTYNGNGCDANANCGTCFFTGALSRACFVVSLSKAGVATATQQTCYYPFGSQQYRPDATSTTIEVMSADDPLLVLQRLTDGSSDFGVTKHRQRNIGICVLVLGVAVLVAFAILAALFMRSQFRKIDARNDMIESARMPYPTPKPPLSAISTPPIVPYNTSYYDMSLPQTTVISGQPMTPGSYQPIPTATPATYPRDSLV
jgi:hypothetical protein